MSKSKSIVFAVSGFAQDSPLEQAGFELAVPPGRPGCGQSGRAGSIYLWWQAPRHHPLAGQLLGPDQGAGPGPARMVAQQVKGLTILVNSIYNGARYEDVWLDK